MSRTEQKERTRAGILRSAAGLLRARGIAGASVADVMKGAGLTVGGFYAHFPSKEALVEHALRATMGEMRAQIVGPEGQPEHERLERALRRYLSVAHRDHPEAGCPLPSVLGELAAEGPALRRALADELDAHVDALAVPRHVALAALALMVGGLSLARALKDTPLSEEVLDACLRFARAALSPAPLEDRRD